MGKVKKSNNSKVKQQVDQPYKHAAHGKHTKIQLRAEDNEVLDSEISQKILTSAKKQQLEYLHNKTKNVDSKNGKVFCNINLSEEDFDNGLNSDIDVIENEMMDALQINPDDKAAIEAFQNPEFKGRTKLSDVILQKIQAKQNDIRVKLSDNESYQIHEIDSKVREMYEGVRDVMKRYRSGKVPKAFKIIPKLKNWEQILFITEPHHWSAAAMFQGTRIFSSVLSEGMTQRFYNLVLLPRIRDDLCEYKRLNVHLYNSLTKALFKPAAFMKGMILPLLESGDCTLREAIIFGSIIARNTIPVLHSSACLLKICEMGYAGANSIFIRIFLEKGYALPYRVVDGAVFHFLRFLHEKKEMPVLWHQSLLSFIQRYKNDISSEQKEAFYGLLRKQMHPKITLDIRRELQAAKCRDYVAVENVNDCEMAD